MAKRAAQNKIDLDALTEDEQLCLSITGELPKKVEILRVGKPQSPKPAPEPANFSPFSYTKNDPELLQQRHDEQEDESHLCTDYEFGKLVTCCEDLRGEYLASLVFLNKEFRQEYNGQSVFESDYQFAPRIQKDRHLPAEKLIQNRVLTAVYEHIRECYTDVANFDDVQDCWQMLAENRYPGNMAKVSAFVRHYGEFVAPTDKRGNPIISRETVRGLLNFNAGTHKHASVRRHFDAYVELKDGASIFFSPKRVRENLNDVDADYAYKAFNAGSHKTHTNPFGFCHEHVASDYDNRFNAKMAEDLKDTVDFFKKRDRDLKRDSTWAKEDDVLRCPSLPITVCLGVAYDQQINLVVQILSYCLFRIWHYEILVKAKRQNKVKAQAANVWAQAQANDQTIQETKKFIIRRRNLEAVASSVQWAVDTQTEHIDKTNKTLPKKRIEAIRAALEKRFNQIRAGLARNFASQVIHDLIPSLVKAHRSNSPATRPNVVVIRKHNSHGVGRNVVLQRGGIPSSVPK